MSSKVIPFSLKGAPALVEMLLPVQKLSAEVYKEAKAGAGQTLTSLGGYWKGRKRLILNKACILGCLLPATDNPRRDLEIFEKLMAMDDESFVIRGRRPTPQEVLSQVKIPQISDYFDVKPQNALSPSSPIDFSVPAHRNAKITWRGNLLEADRRRLEAQALPKTSYRKRVDASKRPEKVFDSVHDHIWDAVNSHLGTSASCFPELVEQLGIMRFGHRPKVADTFCGSGQIPFEAARLGCDVYAADLNPVACMLTWGALHVVGGPTEQAEKGQKEREETARKALQEIDRLGIETDGRGWRAKAYLYCLETKCPQTGWMVPLLPSRIISTDQKAIAELKPDPRKKRYEVIVRSGVTEDEFEEAKKGTVQSDGRGQDPYLVHAVNGQTYRTKVSTIRGDHKKADGTNGNRLRLWEKHDFKPRPEDIFQERLYAIQWMRPKGPGKQFESEFRSVTEEDLKREKTVENFVEKHLRDWQANGWIPDMRIEPGDKTDEPIRTRGWTHWHHLFNPRQLLLLASLKRESNSPSATVLLARLLNNYCKLCIWDPGEGSDKTIHVFYNQALNTLFNYGCRASSTALALFVEKTSHYPTNNKTSVRCQTARGVESENDIYITDPPYGDAVNYEEILEFFIAWIRKNPPSEFADWTWDSRRSLAIKGDGEDFRCGMVAAYKQMTCMMPDNGIQVIMFTHQSGSIWADMANIVWAAGLQVTAAWYVVTETDSGLKDGSYVKGTVLLVARKRRGNLKTTQDDLAWEIQEEVETQIQSLTGLNQEAKGLYRDENLFEDADLQMAGYAAALRALTRYSSINGRDMCSEAARPRVKGEKTFVDELIDFAVDTANRSLVPQGLQNAQWDKLKAAERFYLKLLDLEARGLKALDNYQNLAKAFKVRDFKPFMAEHKANAARLKSAVELGRSEMGEGSEMYNTPLRGTLYALMELTKGVDGGLVLTHLAFNVPNYYDATQRDLLVKLADYLARKLEVLRPEEAKAARVLRDLVHHQKL